MADEIRAVPHRRPRGAISSTSASGSPAPAGPRPRPSTTGRRASRSRTCRSSATYWATTYDWRATEAAAEPLPAVPHRARRARHPLPARALPGAGRAAARHHPRLARLGRRVPQGHRAARPTRSRTAATRRTRSTSCARRCRATASATGRREPGWKTPRIAAAWATLMARLGYDRYGAQGGDWGASVTTCIGQQDAEHVAGIHLNMVIAFPDRSTGRADRARAGRARVAHALPAAGVRATRPSSRPGPRRSGTGWSTPPPGRPRGSSRSSGPGPTATATPRTCSPATSCSTT